MTEHIDKEYCLEIAGDFACFTRPEFKVERVSYDVITPSAVRAIFEAIFWKPAIKWIPTKIEVLSPLDQWMSIRRNEVGKTGGKGKTPITIEENRQQRASQILRDVHYRIYAKMKFIPIAERREDCKATADPKVENPAKYQAIFERRANKGQCFNQPYLGCREFSCSTVKFVENPAQASPKPLQENRDFSIMLYDMDFTHLNEDTSIPAMFYRCKMLNGVIKIPSPDSPEVMR